LNDQLGDPIAASELDRLLEVGVEQADLNLAAVAGIDGARSVDQGHSVPGGKSGPGMDKGCETLRQRDGNPGPNQPSPRRARRGHLGGNRPAARC